MDFRTFSHGFKEAVSFKKETASFISEWRAAHSKNMSHGDIFNRTMTSPDFLPKYFDTGMADKSSIATTDSIDFKPKMKFTGVKIFVLDAIMQFLTK